MENAPQGSVPDSPAGVGKTAVFRVSPTEPLTLGLTLEPTYSCEIAPLEERYPGTPGGLRELEREAALLGYEAGAARVLETTVLSASPWPTTNFGKAREGIASKAAELQQTHPHLNCADPEKYDFEQAQKKERELQEALGQFFPDEDSKLAICTRTKAPDSLARKTAKQLARSDKFTLAHMTDTVGARIDCRDLNSVGSVAHTLEKGFEGKVVAKSDYISNPRDNGYRALHYIVDLGDRMAEIQVTTHSLRKADLATHDTVYKREVPVSEPGAQELSRTADRMMFLECMTQLGLRG